MRRACPAVHAENPSHVSFCHCHNAACPALSDDGRQRLPVLLLNLPRPPRAADDIHAARATVHESLLFSSRLRLGTEVDNQTVVAFVNDVSAELPSLDLTQSMPSSSVHMISEALPVEKQEQTLQCTMLCVE